jgi:hypothetical protein
MALSPRFCGHLAAAANRMDAMAQDENLLWPVTEAAVHGFNMVEVRGCARNFSQPTNIDLNQLLTQILSALFADVEKRAGYWQNTYALTPLRSVNVANVAELPQQPNGAADAAAMYDSFRLAAGHLQDVWSNVLSPGTRLRLQRLVEMPKDKFFMPDPLWVSVVYDFLVAYHTRNVNRMHLSGALVPLYMGWAASYVMRMRELTDEQAESRVAALTASFETDKSYLMSRWRWPDRFTP